MLKKFWHPWFIVTCDDGLQTWIWAKKTEAIHIMVGVKLPRGPSFLLKVKTKIHKMTHSFGIRSTGSEAKSKIQPQASNLPSLDSSAKFSPLNLQHRSWISQISRAITCEGRPHLLGTFQEAHKYATRWLLMQVKWERPYFPIMSCLLSVGVLWMISRNWGPWAWVVGYHIYNHINPISFCI